MQLGALHESVAERLDEVVGVVGDVSRPTSPIRELVGVTYGITVSPAAG
jgi:hypothetical protein